MVPSSFQRPLLAGKKPFTFLIHCDLNLFLITVFFLIQELGKNHRHEKKVIESRPQKCTRSESV